MIPVIESYSKCKLSLLLHNCMFMCPNVLTVVIFLQAQHELNFFKQLLAVSFSNPMSMSLDQALEESLRDDLRYYFMSPCEKYRARRQLPWKLTVQILKIVMITSQVYRYMSHSVWLTGMC